MVEDAKYMNAQARMCACQLWLYFSRLQNVDPGPPIRLVRLRRPGSAWTAASSASCLECWAPQLTAGQRNGAGAAPLARASTTQRAWSTWRPCPHRKRTARCPSWSVMPQTPHATPPLVSPRKARGRVPLAKLLPGALGDLPSGASPFVILDPLSFDAAPLPPFFVSLLSLPAPLFHYFASLRFPLLLHPHDIPPLR